VATSDSGPLRHRYGSARDLVVGIRVALCDGTVARAGGKVIKNVAGYDLAKLFSGSFGALGAILELSVRLHPLPPATATAIGPGSSFDALAAAALALSHAPMELQSLDVRWEHGEGAILARIGGASPTSLAELAARLLSEHGLSAEVVADDDELWEAQRASQRGAGRTVVRVSGLQTQLGEVLRFAERSGARVVGRIGPGLSYVTLPAGPWGEVASGLADLRSALAPSSCVVLDAPADVRAQVDSWGPRDPAALALMHRVKDRFDPAGVCAPGAAGL
jgi:glycolate oxidase FAD binding subunit